MAVSTEPLELNPRVVRHKERTRPRVVVSTPYHTQILATCAGGLHDGSTTSPPPLSSETSTYIRNYKGEGE